MVAARAAIYFTSHLHNLFYRLALHGFNAPQSAYTIIRNDLVPIIIYHDGRLRALVHSNDWRGAATDFVFEGKISDYQELDYDLSGSVYRAKGGFFSILEMSVFDLATVKHEFQHIYNAFILSTIYNSSVNFEGLKSDDLEIGQLSDDLREMLKTTAFENLKQKDADELLARVIGGDSISELEDYLRADAWGYNFAGSITFSLSGKLNNELSILKQQGIAVNSSIYDKSVAFFDELEVSLDAQRRKIFERSGIVILLLKEDGLSDAEILSLLIAKDILSWPELVSADRLNAYQLEKKQDENAIAELLEKENESSIEALSQANQVIEKLLALDLIELANPEIGAKEKRELLYLINNTVVNSFSACEISAATPTTEKVYVFKSELQTQLHDLAMKFMKNILTEADISIFTNWLNEQKNIFQELSVK